MHSIERYGIVAILFLIVTVVAVLMWDGGKAEKPERDRGGAATAAPSSLPGRQRGAREDAGGRRLRLAADSQPGPLTRASADPVHEGAERDEDEEFQPNLWGQEGVLPGAAAARPVAGEPRALEATPVRTLTPPEQPAREEVVGSVPATAGGKRAYRVQAGDTLSEIAQRELGSARRWQEIVAANPGLDPSKLRAGATIQIPGAQAARSSGGAALASSPRTAAKPEPQRAPVSTKAHTWKVQKGESLWKIAQASLGDGKRWREIASLNPKVNPNQLEPGQVLTLPVAAAAKASTPAAPLARTAKPKSEPVVATRAAPEATPRRGGKVK